jgi:GT2 family glycosyltransferase
VLHSWSTPYTRSSRSRAPLDHIVIVDNASTDDTAARVAAAGWLDHPVVCYRRLAENGGGAGGFHAGIAHCVARGHFWIWLADDDALAAPDAVEQLFAAAPDPAHVYASAALYRDPGGATRLCWPIRRTADGRSVRDPALLARCEETPSLPFLGFLISAQLVERIGLPDASLFISGDDLEYIERARRHGARSFLVPSSRLFHPRPDDYEVVIGSKRFFCLRLPPWRRYFYVRNKLIIARRYYGRALWTETLPGLAVRLLATLVYEPARWRQLRAHARGLYDGWRGKGGDPAWRRSL